MIEWFSQLAMSLFRFDDVIMAVVMLLGRIETLIDTECFFN